MELPPNFIHKFFVIILCCACGIDSDPIVQTQNGAVRGTTLVSKGGREFEAFRGIPYARPPIGKLRFKAPKSVRSWNYTFDATKDGPVCIQKNYLFANPKVEGKEDCLYLNVYVPKVQSGNLPVMVSIHWGGFFAGRGTSDYFGPEYIMDKDVILVTFNYRLGVLGFLSSLDDEAPGNYGLKDQVAALKWVQKNIEFFNGDPRKVTIFGASAGAGSVHLHILSPLSKGLFHQAISQSGSGLALWATPFNELHQQILQAQALFFQCDMNSTKTIMSCLRRVDAEALVQSGDAFKYFSVDPLNPYTLVIEKKTRRNAKPFLTKRPLEYIQAKEFENVPWIIGTVQNEGNLRASPLVRQSELRRNLNENYTALMMKEMFYELSVGQNPDSVLALHKSAQKSYMNELELINPDDSENIQGFINLWSDRSMNYPAYQSVMLHSALGHDPIWFYSFEYKGKNSYESLWAATDENINFDWGASHCDDQLYLFNSSALFPEIQDDTDEEMRNILLDRWTNFVVKGAPQRTSGVNHWESLDFTGLDNMKNDNLIFLNITGSAAENLISETMQNGFYKDRMLFWASQPLYENYEGLN